MRQRRQMYHVNEFDCWHARSRGDVRLILAEQDCHVTQPNVNVCLMTTSQKCNQRTRGRKHVKSGQIGRVIGEVNCAMFDIVGWRRHLRMNQMTNKGGQTVDIGTRTRPVRGMSCAKLSLQMKFGDTVL